MEQDRFSLDWTTFDSHCASTFKNLYEENTFTDVTLVSDDNIQFQAHKLVLGACSPILKELLQANPHSHPFLYLRGVKQEHLKSLLQFMYTGETVVAQNINDVLDIAKDLQIKELAPAEIVTEEIVMKSEDHQDLQIKELSLEIVMEEIVTKSEDQHEDEKEESFHNISDMTTADDKKDLKATLNLDGKILDDKIPAPNNDQTQLENHLYKCDKCEAVFRSKLGMQLHSRGKHEGVVFSCNKCDYQTSVMGNLKKHQKAIHEGVKFSCKYCEYQATRPDSLKNHQQSKHEKVKYSCDQCKHKTGWKQELREHKKRKHSLAN